MDVALVATVIPEVENHSLAALRGALVAAGFEVATVGFLGVGDVERAASEIARLRPRVVGVSIQTNQMALPALALTGVLRRRGFAGRIVVGGHFATLNAEDILRLPAGVDVVVRFAGEEALVGLARGLDGDELAALPGVVFRAVDGAVRFGGPARVTGPSVLDAPVRDGELPLHLGFPSADVIFSRGCEAHCAYCCVAGASDLARKEAARAGAPARDAIYDRRSIARIADELASLWHERGARVFNFMDDNVLPLDGVEAAGWVRQLGAALDERRVGRFAFSMQLRADAASPEVLDGLVELGLVRAYVGVDAVSRSALRTLGRRAPDGAGPSALDRLAERGVFAVCNALILGPTFGFDEVLAEIAALERIRHAPVHLYPVDVRAGTSHLAAVERRGLVEGGFLWRRYRFADPRTALLAEVLAAMPTRLAERSVAIGLYDLGYNLGVARRLVPEADLSSAIATYASVAARWNADQLRLLRAAAEPASRLDREDILMLIADEAESVRVHDEALLADCDGALTAVERAVSRAWRRSVRAHARGRLLSALAMSMSLAACNRDVLWTSDQGVGGTVDGAADLLTPPDQASASTDGCAPSTLDACTLYQCNDTTQITLTIDQSGAVASVQATNGTLSQAVADCYHAYFQEHCYPSLAGSTLMITPHCFIA